MGLIVTSSALVVAYAVIMARALKEFVGQGYALVSQAIGVMTARKNVLEEAKIHALSMEHVTGRQAFVNVLQVMRPQIAAYCVLVV